ncbi:MAG: glycosyltransferase family 8 protein [Bradyrhizobiaceae bacterium]|nr:MAG: glycosyltransferase family 8 protein [Bradyrhizobiaceae bacterium]
MTTALNIVSSSDEGYVGNYCALLHSAWLYHPDARFFLLDCGIAPQSLSRLLAFAAERSIDLSIVDAKDRLASELPHYNKRSAFGRVLIPELLPAGIERAIYLDADMTVVGDLTALHEADLGDAVAGVCLDGLPSGLKREEEVQKFDYAGAYFNSGMLLLDFAKWLREGIARQTIAFANENPERLLAMDQSALNLILHGRVKILPNIWNFFNVENGAVNFADVRIVHHTNGRRPWVGYSPFSDIYHFHRSRTPFAIPPTTRTFSDKAAIVRRIALSWVWPKYRRHARRDRLKALAESAITQPAVKNASAKMARVSTGIRDAVTT